MKSTLLFVVATAFIGACAHEVPAQKLEASAAAIRAAEEVGAEKQPAAALHLQLAKEQTDRAQKLIKDGKDDEAAMLLVRAEADANLAVALARSSQEAADAAGALDKVKSLQEGK